MRWLAAVLLVLVAAAADVVVAVIVVGRCCWCGRFRCVEVSAFARVGRRCGLWRRARAPPAGLVDGWQMVSRWLSRSLLLLVAPVVS